MRTPSPAIAVAMASEVVALTRTASLTLGVALSLACTFPAAAASADQPNGPRVPIYKCIDANGKAITSDRPMPECANREHRQLNPDGSLNRIIPPPMTDDERAESERKEREAKVATSAKNDAIRRDRNLMQRFPDEATHKKARAKALDEFNGSVRNYEARIALLTAERTKLRDEAEFYVPLKKPLPAKLKQQIDANDASLEAQNGLVQNQQTEIVRINALYDAELARLKKLWGGAPAGSLGPLPGPQITTVAAPDLTKATATK
jgi:hypothetical protein